MTLLRELYVVGFLFMCQDTDDNSFCLNHSIISVWESQFQLQSQTSLELWSPQKSESVGHQSWAKISEA